MKESTALRSTRDNSQHVLWTMPTISQELPIHITFSLSLLIHFSVTTHGKIFGGEHIDLFWAPIFRTALFYNPYILLDLSYNQFPVNPPPQIFVSMSRMPVGAQDPPWAWICPCPTTELQSHPYQIPQGSWMLFRTMSVSRAAGQCSHPQPPAKPALSGRFGG